MEHLSFFDDFLIVMVVATCVAVILERFRIPSILGFLLSGVVIGPQGLGWISDIEQIHNLAEIGIILLMLTIGLEFSLGRLKGLGKLAVFGGTAQILTSVLLGFGFAWWRGWSMHQGFFLGSVIALSSTAIVLKYLVDRGELDTHYGRVAVSILIFQDFAIVPLMILVTGIGQSTAELLPFLGMAFLKTLILLSLIIVFAKYMLDKILHQIALSRNREILFLASVVICLGTAWLSGKFGLSLAIGAFFAGIMFANTDYGHQLTGQIAPFRHIFVSLFFVSIGLLFDVRFALQNAETVLMLMGLVLVVNFVVVTAVVMAFGYSPRIALASGIILSQIGEFSFLLIQAARHAGGITDQLYNLLLSTAFMTLFITPLMLMMVPVILKFSERVPLFGVHPKNKDSAAEEKKILLKDHVILCGFGPSGTDLAQSFTEEAIPFVLLEMNPGRIAAARQKSYPVLYGDAANYEVMRHAGIDRARAVVVSFGDAIGMTQIIRVVEDLNPEVLLVVRTRFEKDVARLYELGADIVVMEELEASHELNRTILKHFDVSDAKIEKHLERILMRKELLIEQGILRAHITLDKS